MGIHSIISASGWERAAKCAGSILLSHKYGVREETEHTKRGDKLHDLAHSWLKAKVKYERDGEVDPGDAPVEVMEYTEWVWNEIVKESVTGKLIGIEVLISAHDELGKGTTPDIFILARDSKGRYWLVIIDLKTGHNVVEAPNNYQMAFYFLAILFELSKRGITEISGADTYIYRLGHEEPVSYFRWTKSTIKKHALLLQKRIEQTLLVEEGKTVKLPFKAGDWCRYCKVRGRCKVRKEFAVPEDVHDLAPVTTKKSVNLPDPALLTDEQVALVCRHKGQMEKWLKDVWSSAMDRERNGDHIYIGKKRQFKMVGSSGKRSLIKDSKVLIKKIQRLGFEDELLETKIKGGIGVAEKLLGVKTVAPYVVPGRESATLALWDDKRPALEDLTSLLTVNDEEDDD